MTGPWSPPPGPPPVSPGPAAPPHTSRRTNRAVLAFAAVVGLIGVIAATAAITYAVTRPSTPPPARGSTSSVASPDQQAAAKKRLCEVFDAGTKNQAGKGGVRIEGQLNVPVVLRMMNSAAAVNSAITPEVPADVAAAARNYVARTYDLTSEALDAGNIETLERLNDEAIKAIDSLVGVCGLPR